MKRKYELSGPDCAGARKYVGQSQNNGTLASPLFIKACGLAKVEPTRRQASKWNNNKGSAYGQRFAARNSL